MQVPVTVELNATVKSYLRETAATVNERVARPAHGNARCEAAYARTLTPDTSGDSSPLGLASVD